MLLQLSLTKFQAVYQRLHDSLRSNAQTLQQCIESLSSKLGWVIMIIGLMHFTMLTVFAAMGRRLNPVAVRTGNAAKEAEPAGTVHQLVKRLHEND